MLQKVSTNVKKYIHNDVAKTVDFSFLLWYYIVKERETENLINQRSAAQNKSLMKDRIDLRRRQIMRGL